MYTKIFGYMQSCGCYLYCLYLLIDRLRLALFSFKVHLNGIKYRNASTNTLADADISSYQLYFH